MVRALGRWDAPCMNSTAHTDHFADSPDHLFYVESSIPPGLTLNEYRRSRPRPTPWERLKQLAGGAQVATARAA
jgi:hypothetical protein